MPRSPSPRRASRSAPRRPPRSRPSPSTTERGVRPARGFARRAGGEPPAVTKFYVGLGHEQFPPDQLLEQAIVAEDAGFDGIGCSDHFQPWWEPGESGQAWVWLGALGQATRRVAIGSGGAPAMQRYHPALVAQAFATLEAMNPGRAYLGLGSGESLNESPFGMDWPSP